MNVKLIGFTPEPDRVVSMAAKLCYSPVGVEEIDEKISDDEVERFLSILVSLGHESPIEHVSFTFAVEGISRACTHQLVRHRIASYSQQSQRYVKLSQFQFIIPPAIERIDEAKDIFIEAMKKDQEAYDKIVDCIYNKEYERLLAEGKTEKKAMSIAEKIAIEDARYVFPNACETKIVLTMNARSLYNFFAHRICERAQWEIREMAYKMLEECKKVAPVLFKKAGPSCYFGACKEGSMSCGHPEIPRDRIGAM
ncbi:MAG: FAD-dependent thymidylate synthase [Filifactoraceae bacterium]